MRISVFALLATALQVGCVNPGTSQAYNGPTAPSQVVYRIDEHRYFEIVPRLSYACIRGDLYYVDRKREIRSRIPGWDRMERRGELVIDANNDQYLIAPIAGMDADCAPNSHPAHCASFMVYSQNAGRTWEITKQLRKHEYNGALRLIGDTVYYAGQRAKLSALAAGDSAWSEFPPGQPNTLPPPDRPPLDTELHCDNSKTIQRKND